MVERVLEREAQGCKSPLKSVCMRTTPVAVSKASVMTIKGLVVSGRARTGPWVKVTFNVLNVTSHSVVQSHFAPFLVRSWRSWAIVEKSGMNFQ